MGRTASSLVIAIGTYQDAIIEISGQERRTTDRTWFEGRQNVS